VVRSSSGRKPSTPSIRLPRVRDPSMRVRALPATDCLFFFFFRPRTMRHATRAMLTAWRRNRFYLMSGERCDVVRPLRDGVMRRATIFLPHGAARIRAAQREARRCAKTRRRCCPPAAVCPTPILYSVELPLVPLLIPSACSCCFLHADAPEFRGWPEFRPHRQRFDAATRLMPFDMIFDICPPFHFFFIFADYARPFLPLAAPFRPAPPTSRLA